MSHSFFYIVGGLLVLSALVIAFLGMRSDSFPSAGAMRAGIAFVAVVVVATAYGAVVLAQDEAQEREHEANIAASEAEEEQTEENQGAGESGVREAESEDDGPIGGGESAVDSESGGEAQAGGGGGAATAAQGSKVFVSAGCGSCHTIASLGSDAQGTVGPNLDTELAGDSDEQIRTSIVDPSAEITKGFPDGTMPDNYEEQLSAGDIDALVAFLSAEAGN